MSKIGDAMYTARVILSNDEASTDKELFEHFTKVLGITEIGARDLISRRDYYLRGSTKLGAHNHSYALGTLEGALRGILLRSNELTKDAILESIRDLLKTVQGITQRGDK